MDGPIALMRMVEAGVGETKLESPFILAWTAVSLLSSGAMAQSSSPDQAPPRLEVRGAEGVWAPGPDARRLPLGVWIEVGDVVAYTYVDRAGGPSAQWHDEDGIAQIRRVSLEPAGLKVIDAAARRARGLPERPEWVAHYGPQPLDGRRWGPWRDDPRLASRFHPEYPDDLRVAVSGAGAIEYVWISLRSCSKKGCSGRLLNQPMNVPLELGQTLTFAFEHVPTRGLIPATAEGRAPTPEFVAAAHRIQGEESDAAILESAPDAQGDERLVPVYQWSRLGEELVYIHVTEVGPVFEIFSPDGSARTVVEANRPAALEPLTAAEVAELGLPPSPFGDEEQPPPFLFGRWRVDPFFEKFLGVAGHPDLLLLRLVPDVGLAVPIDETELVTGRMLRCAEAGCEVRLLEPAPKMGLVEGSTLSVSRDVGAYEGALLVPVGFERGR
ncbi:MAG: hypothetical protein AAFZ18_00350 [Myxococcota bacterium]